MKKNAFKKYHYILVEHKKGFGEFRLNESN